MANVGRECDLAMKMAQIMLDVVHLQEGPPLAIP